MIAAVAGIAPQTARAASEFPAGDEAYHTYAEMLAEIQAAAVDHPGIVQLSSIGRSHLGREIWMAKVSDNVTVDEDEPEVMVDGLVHAREHMSAEMALALFATLTDQYGGGGALGRRVTSIVDSREIFIVFMANPDGGQYDISGGQYRYWRKNRQPTPGSSSIGTDINRNFDYRWGCCGGSSATPSAWNYRGPAAWSTPEARVLRDFVESRVVGGVQQLRVAISLHTQGRLVLWPYGWTTSDLPLDMTADDQATFVAMGTAMAASNGYTAQQTSDLYITSGSKGDWVYERHRVFTFTFELTLGRYPDDSEIGPETSRNIDALLYATEQADCPYRAAGLEERHCGPFSDDFETGRGWVVNPDGTDTATSGRWERSDPERTADVAGTRQPGNPTSGRRGMITGPLAGGGPARYDLDGGTTTARSRPIRLPVLVGGATHELRFRWSFAHNTKSTPDDRFAAVVVNAGGTTTTVFLMQGSATDRLAFWRTATVDLSAWAGQTVSIQLEATDAGPGSLVEAGVDDLSIA
ncbi:MAG: zinc carboxypeptidase, partial [Chloroflexi bacterium]|nr:zinc carboxypeptidase [Chloroflexota bacterium]